MILRIVTDRSKNLKEMISMLTHGSLTKAGKVRNQTPKLAFRKKNLGLRRRKLRDYWKMLSDSQNVRGGKRRRRRR